MIKLCINFKNFAATADTNKMTTLSLFAAAFDRMRIAGPDAAAASDGTSVVRRRVPVVKL
jgi:hypothetical protein